MRCILYKRLSLSIEVNKTARLREEKLFVTGFQTHELYFVSLVFYELRQPLKSQVLSLSSGYHDSREEKSERWSSGRKDFSRFFPFLFFQLTNFSHRLDSFLINLLS